MLGVSCYYFYIVLSLYLYCCYVMYPDHHFIVIYLQTCVCLCLSCYYFYIVLSLYLYCCYVMYPDHHFTVIYLKTCVCLCLSCYYFYIVLSLYLYCRYVMYTDHHFTVIYLQTCVLCVCLVITSTLFIFILVLLCCVSRSSLYCNIPSDLCSLCLSCYYFYIVYSLYLYCRYVMYPDHHFTLISLQTLRGSHGPDHMVVAFTTTCASQCQSLLILLIRISIRERCTTLCDKVCL